METLKQKATRYFVSSLITFVSAFLLTYLATVIGALEAGTQLTGTLLLSAASGAFTAALRLLLKYLYEILEAMPQPEAIKKVTGKFKRK